MKKSTMDSSENKIAGLVILFNPESVVIENVKSYLKQISHLYIIDNSVLQRLPVSKTLKECKDIEFLENNNNIGIATALNIGANKAVTDGYRFLLLLDQDSIASTGMVNKLLDVHLCYDTVGISAAYPIDKNYPQMPQDNEIHRVSKVITSGSLLDLEVYNYIGPFLDKLFIDYVDFEYCMRLRKEGFQIYQCNSAILYHSVGNLTRWNILGINFYSTNHSPLRLYYRTRNRFYLRKLYFAYFREFFKHDMISFYKEILKVIIIESNKFKKLKMITKGYLHYRQNIFGRAEFE